MEKKSLKIISIGLAVLLLLSIITIAILATLLVVRTQDVIDFSNPNTEIQKEQTYALSNVNFKSVSDVNQSNMQTVNVVAKIKPFNASDKRLKWTTSWANANSEWANGKAPTDYVSIIVDNGDSRKAKITLLEAFGEIIVLTVTSVSNPDVSKSVEIRCIADLDFVTTFEFGGVEYILTKDGFKNIGLNFDVYGTSYNYPTGSKEDFNLKSNAYYPKVSTNEIVKPYVTFYFKRNVHYLILTSSVKYMLEYDYLNSNEVKVPIVIEENKEVLPTKYENPYGVKEGEDLDVSQTTMNISSLDDVLYAFLGSATKDKKLQSGNLVVLEMKFMGTGPTINMTMRFSSI